MTVPMPAVLSRIQSPALYPSSESTGVTLIVSSPSPRLRVRSSVFPPHSPINAAMSAALVTRFPSTDSIMSRTRIPASFAGLPLPVPPVLTSGRPTTVTPSWHSLTPNGTPPGMSIRPPSAADNGDAKTMSVIAVTTNNISGRVRPAPVFFPFFSII